MSFDEFFSILFLFPVFTYLQIVIFNLSHFAFFGFWMCELTFKKDLPGKSLLCGMNKQLSIDKGIFVTLIAPV